MLLVHEVLDVFEKIHIDILFYRVSKNELVFNLTVPLIDLTSHGVVHIVKISEYIICRETGRRLCSQIWPQWAEIHFFKKTP